MKFQVQIQMSDILVSFKLCQRALMRFVGQSDGRSSSQKIGVFVGQSKKCLCLETTLLIKPHKMKVIGENFCKFSPCSG